MSLMRKLMNLDEFQSVGSNANNVSNNDASKQFHPYTNGVFNGKMLTNSTATNFAFPYEKHQQPQQHHMNGLLKPCYDFSSAAPTKSEPLDEANFNSGFATKKPSQVPLFGNSTGNGGNGGGFMNQFSHHHDYGNHQAFATKLNEINNNNSGGGIVVKLENGTDFNPMRTTSGGGTTSTMVVNKTEPNEFRNSSCKDNHVDNEDDGKVSIHPHDNDSNDGFTQL